jgi:hypothetical protein
MYWYSVLYSVRRLTSKVLADAKKDAKYLNYLIKNLHLEKIIEIALYINIRVMLCRLQLEISEHVFSFRVSMIRSYSNQMNCSITKDEAHRHS